jgi:hypothetical protein
MEFEWNDYLEYRTKLIKQLEKSDNIGEVDMEGWWRRRVPIEEMVGCVFTDIKSNMDDGEAFHGWHCYDYTEQLFFLGEKSFYMKHDQQCCEKVLIEEIIGHLPDLIGTPILRAEERSSEGERLFGSAVEWTFYELATINGSVTIRWRGASNGYYGTSVELYQLSKKKPEDVD